MVAGRSLGLARAPEALHGGMLRIHRQRNLRGGDEDHGDGEAARG